MRPDVAAARARPELANPWVVCPFDRYHVMPLSTLQKHMTVCRLSHEHDALRSCPYNYTHAVADTQYAHHLATCPDRPDAPASGTGAAAVAGRTAPQLYGLPVSSRRPRPFSDSDWDAPPARFTAPAHRPPPPPSASPLPAPPAPPMTAAAAAPGVRPRPRPNVVVERPVPDRAASSNAGSIVCERCLAVFATDVDYSWHEQSDCVRPQAPPSRPVAAAAAAAAAGEGVVSGPARPPVRVRPPRPAVPLPPHGMVAVHTEGNGVEYIPAPRAYGAPAPARVVTTRAAAGFVDPLRTAATPATTSVHKIIDAGTADGDADADDHVGRLLAELELTDLPRFHRAGAGASGLHVATPAALQAVARSSTPDSNTSQGPAAPRRTKVVARLAAVAAVRAAHAAVTAAAANGVHDPQLYAQLAAVLQQLEPAQPPKPGSETRSGSETGSGTGSETRSETGPETGSGIGSETGSGIGPGTGSGTNTGSVTTPAATAPAATEAAAVGAAGLGSVELDAPSLAAPAHAAEGDSDGAAPEELVASPGLTKVVGSDEAPAVETVVSHGLVAEMDPEPTAVVVPGLTARVDSDGVTPDALEAVLLPVLVTDMDAQPDAMETIASSSAVVAEVDPKPDAIASPAVGADVEAEPDAEAAITSPALGAEVDAEPDAIASPAVDSNRSATTVLPPVLGLDS